MQDWDVGVARDSQQLDRELQVRTCSRSPAVLRNHTKHVLTPYHHSVMLCRDLPVSLSCKLAYSLPTMKQQRLMLRQTYGKSVRMASIQLWQVTTGFLISSWLKHLLATFQFSSCALHGVLLCSFWLPMRAPVAVSGT